MSEDSQTHILKNTAVERIKKKGRRIDLNAEQIGTCVMKMRDKNCTGKGRKRKEEK